MKLSLSIMVIFIITGCANQPAVNKEFKILDYWPLCEYEKIKKISASELGRFSESVNDISDTLKNDALKKITNKAKELGADSLILIGRNVNKNTKRHRSLGRIDHTTAELTYTGWAINDCEPTAEQIANADQRHIATFDHQGNRAEIDANFKFKISLIDQPVSDIADPTQKETSFSMLDKHQITFATGIYGLPLGASKKELFAYFGVPDAELYFSRNLTGYLYGHRHLFYVQDNHLVKFELRDWIFKPELSNLLPYRDGFDDSVWTTTESANMGTLFKDFNRRGQYSVPDKDGTLNLKEGSVNLDLHFLRQRRYTDNFQIHRLNRLAMSLSDFHFDGNQYAAPEAVKFINAPMAWLATMDESPGVDELIRQLGQPAARIIQSPKKTLLLYGDSLLFTIINQQIYEFRLMNSAWTPAIAPKTKQNQWQVGRLTFAEVRQLWPELSSEFGAELSLENERYNIQFIFSDDGPSATLDSVHVYIYK